MTISATTPVQQYNGTGANTALPTVFAFFVATDIVVTQRVVATGVDTTMVRGVHYALTGGSSTGATGTVTPSDGATDFTTDMTWTIERSIPLTQELDYVENDIFPAVSHEAGLDRLTMQSQDREQIFNRSMRFPVADVTSLTSEIPNAVARASKALTFDSAGNVVVTDPADASGTSVTATGSTTARTLQERFASVVNVRDFGAVGDGVTDDTAAVNLAVAAFNAIGEGAVLYFPHSGGSGVTGYLSSSGQIISMDSQFQSIIGDGYGSHLKDFGVRLNKRAQTVSSLRITGLGASAPTNSIHVEPPTGSIRGGSFINIWIENNTAGIAFFFDGNIAAFKMEGCHTHACGTGLHIEELEDTQIVNCDFVSCANYGVHAVGPCAQIKMVNVQIQNAGKNGMLIDATNEPILGFYSHNLSISSPSQYSTADQYGIVSIVDSSGFALVTSASHKFFTGIENVFITGTANHDGGPYKVTSASSGTVVLLDLAFNGTEGAVGNIEHFGWDLLIVGPLTQSVNDFWFNGGNINYTKLESGYNINFVGTALKSHIWLDDGAVNRVFFNRNGRGRQVDSELDIPVTGAKTGWAEIIYTDTSTAFLPGTGGILMRTPDKNGTLVANIVDAHHEVKILEDGISITSMALGGGAEISKHLSASASLNFPSTTTLNSSDLTIAVVGAVVGDTVSLGIPAASVLAKTSFNAWVSATDVVTVRFNNYSSGTLDPDAGTFRVDVWQH